MTRGHGASQAGSSGHDSWPVLWSRCLLGRPPVILETFGVRLSTIEEIEQQSQSTLIDAYGRMADAEPPVDLNRVTKALRLSIKAGTFSDRDLAGYYDKSARTIYVSK